MPTPEQLKARGLQLLRDDLRVFCGQCLKVKPKTGSQLVPFVWNEAQAFIHERLEQQKRELGFVRAIVTKGRQQGCCLAPETRVLTAGLQWVRIDSLQPGAELVAVDEETSSGVGGRGRLMRTATVEAVVFTRQPSYRVTLSDGRSVVTSGRHRWLVRKSQTQWRWRSIDGQTPDRRDSIKVGDKFRSVTVPWGDATLEDAWFGGMIDGEGSMDQSKSRCGIRLAVSQRAGAVWDRMNAHAAARGYGAYTISDDGPRKTKYGLQPVHALNVSSMREMFRLIGLSRPTRFVSRRWWEGKSMPDNGELEIVSIEPLGERDVVDIQTSTGTFIAEGFVSHNSTYIAARFYHRTSFTPATSAFILAHEIKATNNLYAMVRRFHDHNPIPVSTGATNAQELVFDKLDSGYKLATAGTKDVGRSNTAQLLHASEAAFYANAEQHMAGIGNTVADLPGTEIILESTANGLGNYFHQAWQRALRGEGLYIPIFVPWFWQSEYRSKPRANLSLSAADEEVMRTYGLDLEQMQWRADKIASYGEGFEWLFRQEFPNCESEAWQSGTTNPLVSLNHVNAAALSTYYDEHGPLIIGVDPAGDGDGTEDRTAIAFRRGRLVLRIEYHDKLNTMQVAGLVADLYREHQPDALVIDKGGLGAGVVDRLRELGIPVVDVMFGAQADQPDLYANKRAEMWWRMAEWFADQPVRIPNDPALISDLCAPMPDTSSNGRKLLESKEKMKRRGIRSPDGGDALALTFAYSFQQKVDPLLRENRQHYEPASRAGY